MKKFYRFSAILIILTILSGMMPLGVLAQEGNLPSSYDLRDYGLMSSVKNQSPYGACWAFATCAASESNMIKNGIYGSDIDLSELHLAYYCFNRPNDPLGNTPNESAYLNNTSFSFMSVGGDSGLSQYTLMTWAGPVFENDVPYGTAEEVKANGLDLSYAYVRDAAHLKAVYQIPMSQPNKVKQALLDYGALWMSFNDYSSNPDIPCYNPETAAYYNVTGDQQGHAVTIAGWDDNYPVENFLEGHRPSSPGAWLIKDSVGTSWGIDGYWWASYEDLDFGYNSTKNAAAFDYCAADTYDNNYQYDGGSGNTYRTIMNTSQVSIANVFTAQGEETLEAVSFSISQYESVGYQVFVYRNLTDENDPTSGESVYYGYGETRYKGYQSHEFAPEEFVSLEDGDVFSVVISYTVDPSLGEICFDIDKANATRPIGFNAHGGNNQSFYSFESGYDISYDVNWFDLSDYSDANVRIKAYTTDVGRVKINPTLTLIADPAKMTYIEGQPLDLSGLNVIYTNSTGGSYQVNAYNASIANGTILTMADNGKKITINYNGLSVETTAAITVATKQLSSLELVSEPYKLLYSVGESFAPRGLAVTAVFDNGDRVPVTDLAYRPAGALQVTDEAVSVEYTYEDKTCSVSIPVTVRENVAIIDTMVFEPGRVEVEKGHSAALSPVITPSGAGIGCLKWSSADTSVVQVDENGVVTAVSRGETVITATATDGSGKTAECTVNVFVTASGVTVSPSSKSLIPGEVALLTPNVSPADTTDKSVTWSSDNEAVASVNVNGAVTAIATGTANITVSTANGHTAICVIRVVAEDSTEYTGFSGNLINDGTEYEITTYSGSNPVAVMPRTLNGIPVTAVASYAFMENNNISHLIVADSVTRMGSNVLSYSTRWVESITIPDSVTTISSYCLDDCYTTIKCYENSAAHKYANKRGYDVVLLFRMTVDAPKTELNVGEQMTLTSAVTPSAIAEQGITWTSGNPSVASVDSNGVVTAVSRGYVRITATASNGSTTDVYVRILSQEKSMAIYCLDGSPVRKISWWKKYSAETMTLGCSTYNCPEAVRFVWSSSNSNVKIDQNGNITNKGIFSRFSTVTLTAYDAGGNIVGKGSIRVGLYKFSFQK